jgi:hypothetical protein
MIQRTTRSSTHAKNNHTISLVDYLEREHLKKIGATIASARRRQGLKQFELGQRLWAEERLSQTAAQTRIYRLERGAYELTYSETHRLFDILEITDIDARTLRPLTAQDQHGFLLDLRALELYPDLADYLCLINKTLRRNDLAQLKEVFRTMCRYLANTEPNIDAAEDQTSEEHTNGGHPFTKGAAD